jgi:uncharacterized membrane protein HdeD (DUF308 family)
MVLVGVTEEGAQAARAVLYALLVFGLLMLGLGVFLIASPHETLKIVTEIVGICLIVDGAIAAIGAALGRVESRGLLALVGIISVLAGLVLLRKPFSALYLFVTIIGIWFVTAGVARFVTAFSLSDGRGSYIAGAVLDVVAGILILSWKDISLATLAVVLGIVLVLRGLTLAYIAWKLLRIERASGASGAPQPA